jgi:nicotinamide-nucleotide amidase
MLAEIITIGDEILIGQIVDTNSAYLGQTLNLNGIAVKQITSISDNRDEILKTLHEASQRASIVIITGGLGPTKDDITKKTLCEYFNCSYRFDEDVLKDVENIFAQYGKEVTPTNRMQAEIPALCQTIRNHNGTAPGMWFDIKNTVYVSMPGVPYEMKNMFERQVIPKLKQRFTLPHIYHHTLLTQGVGESYLSDLITDWENSLAALNIKLAYLPSPGMVRLRLSTSGNELEILKKNVAQKTKELHKLIGEYIYGYETFGEHKKSLEEIVGTLLRNQCKTIATAESCTGGYIAHLLTRLSGSSDFFQGGIVSYSNKIKTNELDVSEELLMSKGAVSQEVVEQMASRIQKRFNTNCSIATSGIAGPTGGTDEKPVGTVWIAIVCDNKMWSQKFLFGNHRERTIQKTADAALNQLRKFLEK